MGRVAAQPLIAQMVDLLFARHIAVVVGEGHDMGGDGLAIEAHSSVVSAPTSPGSGALPDVAGRGLPLNDKPGILNEAPGLDAFNDAMSPGGPFFDLC